jgi:hypothetical protein
VEFSAQLADPPSWCPYDAASGTRRGLWVDEDTRLVFWAVAWDNVNWRTALDPKGAQMTWTITDWPGKGASDAGPVVPKTALPADAEGRFEYTFRDPNVGGESAGGECSLLVTAVDAASPPNRREVKIHFAVAANSLVIRTLEEMRRQR